MDAATVTNRITAGSAAVPGPAPPRGKQASKRRFPGPAGLLPTLRHNEFVHLNGTKLGDKNPITEKINKIISSVGESVPAASQNGRPFLTQQILSQSQSHQSDSSLFEELTWQTLLSQLDLSPNENNPNSLTSLMNIRWISERAVKLQLPACIRIPILVVMIQETNEFTVKSGFCKVGNPNLSLVDPTGTIEAAVDPSFLASYGNYLNAGTALALKNVGVYQHKRDVTLIITEGNVICMTSKDQDHQQHPDQCQLRPRPNPFSSFLTADSVRVTHFCNFKADEILKELHLINLPESDAGLNEDEDDDENQVDENPGSILYQSSSHFGTATATATTTLGSMSERSGNPRNKFSFQFKSDLSQSLDRINRIQPPVPQLFKPPLMTSPFCVPTSTHSSNSDNTFGDDDEEDEIFRLLQTEEEANSNGAQNHKPSLRAPGFVPASQVLDQNNFQIVEFDEREPTTGDDMSGDNDDELFLHCGESNTEDIQSDSSYSPKTPPEDSQGEMPLENDDDIFIMCTEIESSVSRALSNLTTPPPTSHPSRPSQLCHIPSADSNSQNTAAATEQHKEDRGDEAIPFTEDDDEDEFFNLLEGIDNQQ